MRISKRCVNTLARTMAVVVAMLPFLAFTGVSANDQQVECTNRSGGQFKAVATTATRVSTVDFSASGGQLDPVPLLETEIRTGATCVLVHFSAQAVPLDNAIVFQASIDDVLMEGHALSPPFTTPVVFDPEETNLNLPRMVAYTFFLRVGPGSHTVRIRFAGCCSAIPGGGSGVVRSAVMSVHY